MPCTKHGKMLGKHGQNAGKPRKIAGFMGKTRVEARKMMEKHRKIGGSLAKMVVLMVVF